MMKNTQISEHIAYDETKVECPKCHVTMIATVADLRSNKLLRCPACRTPINDLDTPEEMLGLILKQDEREGCNR